MRRSRNPSLEGKSTTEVAEIWDRTNMSESPVRGDQMALQLRNSAHTHLTVAGGKEGFEEGGGPRNAENESLMSQLVKRSTGARQENIKTSADANKQLPPRLFATDKYPSESRVNSYSNLDFLLEIVEILDGSPELEWLKQSCFGRLFELPISESSLSGKLVHQFISRSLVTNKKHKLWFVFGAYPVRFSLQEFALLTGLNCNPYPSEKEVKKMQTPEEGEDDYWYELIGPKKNYNIDDIVSMMKTDKKLPTSERMSGGRRLRLTLIVLVEGVLTAKSSVLKARRKVVQMVKDLDTFVKYPWGRKSFEHTVEMAQVGGKMSSASLLASKLCLSHFTTHGFTLALQLLILNTIPNLRKMLPKPKREATFATLTGNKLKRLKTFHNANIVEAERDPNLQVESILQEGFPHENTDFSWPDEEEDERVDYICHRILNGPIFSKGEWWGGRADLPLITDVIGKGISNVGKGSKDEAHPNLRSRKLAQEQRQEKDRSESSTKNRRGMGRCDNKLCGEYILREIERMNNEHMAKVQQMFEIEKSIMGDELYDSVVRAVRSEFMAGKQTAGLAEDKAGGSSVKGDSVQSPNIEGILKIVLDKCNQSDVGLPDIWKELSTDNERGMFKSTRDACVKSNEEIESDKEWGESKGCAKVNNQAGRENEEGANSDFNSRVKTHKGSPRREYVAHSFGKHVERSWENVGNNSAGSEAETGRKKAETYEGQAQNLGDLEEKGDTNSDGMSVEMLRPEGKIGEEDTAFDEGGERAEAKTTHNETKASTTAEKTVEEVGNTEIGSMLGKRRLREDDIKNVYSRQRRSNRERRNPKRFGFYESQAEKPRTRRTQYVPLAMVTAETRKKFIDKLSAQGNREFAVNGIKVTNKFFEEILQPTGHINSMHMEAMLSLVWQRAGVSLQQQRVVILDTWFIHGIGNEHARYMKAKATEVFTWNNVIKDYVKGKLASRTGNLAWIKDVDWVYAPMHWGKGHWVAIAIDLKNGNILILDALTSLTTNRQLGKLMKPLVEILPDLIRDNANVEEAAYKPPEKFRYERMSNIYQNTRTGDCGPLTVKFVELHAHGIPINGLTDDIVDEIRMKYAVDVFEQSVGEL